MSILKGFAVSVWLTMAWISLRLVWHQLCWVWERVFSYDYWAMIGNEALFHLVWFFWLWVIMSVLVFILSLGKKKKQTPSIDLRGLLKVRK